MESKQVCLCEGARDVDRCSIAMRTRARFINYSLFEAIRTCLSLDPFYVISMSAAG